MPYSADVLNRKRKYLNIDRHLKDGQNIIIAGSVLSGKTLLGVLILKEIANAAYVGKDLDYRWVRLYNIIDAARWTNAQPIKQSYLDNLAELDFLFVDDVATHRGGHNAPPDHIAMNTLFGTRRLFGLPTIFICSLQFLRMVNNHQSREVLADTFGEEMVKLLIKKNNVIIELIRE